MQKRNTTEEEDKYGPIVSHLRKWIRVPPMDKAHDGRWFSRSGPKTDPVTVGTPVGDMLLASAQKMYNAMEGNFIKFDEIEKSIKHDIDDVFQQLETHDGWQNLGISPIKGQPQFNLNDPENPLKNQKSQVCFSYGFQAATVLNTQLLPNELFFDKSPVAQQKVQLATRIATLYAAAAKDKHLGNNLENSLLHEEVKKIKFTAKPNAAKVVKQGGLMRPMYEMLKISKQREPQAEQQIKSSDTSSQNTWQTGTLRKNKIDSKSPSSKAPENANTNTLPQAKSTSTPQQKTGQPDENQWKSASFRRR